MLKKTVNEKKIEEILEGIAYTHYSVCQSFTTYVIRGEDKHWISWDDYNSSDFPDEFDDFMEKNKGKKVRLTLKLELVE